MKTCPVCHARAFDDAEVCFGCLHRFAEDEPPKPAPSQGGDAAAQGFAAMRGGPAAQRASRAPRPAPCPFPGGRSVPATTRAVPASDGGSARELRLPEPPLDAGGWIVRFEFPGFNPVDGPSGASSLSARGDGSKAEGLVVSVRPGAAVEAPQRLGRGVHAREDGRQLLEAVRREGA